MKLLPFLTALFVTLPCLAEPIKPYVQKSEGEPIGPYVEKAVGDVGKLGGLWKVISCQSKNNRDSYKPGYAMFSGRTAMVANEGWTNCFSFNFRIVELEGHSYIGLTAPHDLECQKEMPGIYSVNGDSMKIFFSSEVNGSRPAEFSIDGSDKHTLLTLKRLSIDDEDQAESSEEISQLRKNITESIIPLGSF